MPGNAFSVLLAMPRVLTNSVMCSDGTACSAPLQLRSFPGAAADTGLLGSIYPIGRSWTTSYHGPLPARTWPDLNTPNSSALAQGPVMLSVAG